MDIRQNIRLSKSSITNLEKKYVIDVLNKEFLGMGKEVQIFENLLKEFFGREAICVVNGTAALHLALQSCNIGFGDEVIVPTLTYISSFQAISATGATPIACDINSVNFCIDITDLESKITKKTKAIMPVHYTGGCGELDKIYKIAKKYNLRVIEDAAHAFGSYYKDKKIGSFGDIVCFSFDGIKNITSGEGGCVITSDKKVIKYIKDARLLGVEKDTESRFKGKRTWDFDVKIQGWRYHMSNIMASIGIAQLSRFKSFEKKRKEIAIMYDTFFKSTYFLKIINHDYQKVVPHIYVVRILGLKNRKHLQDLLLNKNIQTGAHYNLNHKLSFYKKNVTLKNAENIFPELLTLPMHYDLTKNDIKYICKELIATLNENKNLFIL
jgi:dTDP-4-amino-4,6-dideoxygalactose transaminase